MSSLRSHSLQRRAQRNDTNPIESFSMNNKQAKIFAAEIGADIPVLDLHGFYPSEALDMIDPFVYGIYKNKEQVGRIIYGGGTGVLRREVLQYLQKHPLVEDVVEEGGSCIFLIYK